MDHRKTAESIIEANYDFLADNLEESEREEFIEHITNVLIENSIPRYPRGARYLCETTNGKLLYLNHANQWQECPNFIRDGIE